MSTWLLDFWWSTWHENFPRNTRTLGTTTTLVSYPPTMSTCTTTHPDPSRLSSSNYTTIKPSFPRVRRPETSSSFPRVTDRSRYKWRDSVRWRSPTQTHSSDVQVLLTSLEAHRQVDENLVYKIVSWNRCNRNLQTRKTPVPGKEVSRLFKLVSNRKEGRKTRREGGTVERKTEQRQRYACKDSSN